MFFFESIKNNLYNVWGWSSKRHILVIESDDWGSIRMPSRLVYEELQKRGVKFGNYGYEQYDTIASCGDLQNLFEICDSIKDNNNNSVIITANCVVANPDFEQIKEHEYKEYYYEPVTETLARYYPKANPFTLWHEGIDKKVFYPQLHGREHVNAQMWLNSLRENHKGARAAFERGVYSIIVDKNEDIRQRNTTAYRYLHKDEKPFYKNSIIDAQTLFKKMFNYTSKSFIAPAYSWDEDIERWLNEIGVQFIQGVPMHFYNGKRSFHYVGKRNKYGQTFLIRNACWEPTQNPDKDNNDECLQQIATAFRWGKPATISTHRINFVGSLNVKKRDENLRLFYDLLKRILKEWPDVVFMTSPELGTYILNNE